MENLGYEKVVHSQRPAIHIILTDYRHRWA